MKTLIALVIILLTMTACSSSPAKKSSDEHDFGTNQTVENVKSYAELHWIELSPASPAYKPNWRAVRVDLTLVNISKKPIDPMTLKRSYSAGIEYQWKGAGTVGFTEPIKPGEARTLSFAFTSDPSKDKGMTFSITPLTKTVTWIY